MLTAQDGRAREARALDAGADDFLAKPFSFVVLLARLRALVAAGAASGRPCSRSGTSGSTPRPTACWRGDVEVALTPRQFALLEFLMRHPGEVVSRRTILDHVWDFAFEGDPNIVEVYEQDRN